MPDDVAIEARVPAELHDTLVRLAASAGKSKSEIVREILTNYLLWESYPALSDKEFAAKVEEGRAALRAGEVADHAEVIREIDELLSRKR